MATGRSEVPLGSSPKRPRLDQDFLVSTAGPHVERDLDEALYPESSVVAVKLAKDNPSISSPSPIRQQQPGVYEASEVRPNDNKPGPSDGENTTLDPGISPTTSATFSKDFDVDELDVRSMRVVSTNWPGTSSEMMSPTGKEHPPAATSEAEQEDSHKHEDNEIDSDLDLGLGELSPEPISGPLGWLHHKMMTGVDPRTILARILPRDFSLPSDMTDLNMWGLIVEYFQAFQEPEKRKKLADVNTLDDAVSLLRRSSNIIVLSGAGVSVSCGIPDFRSRDGIYARLAIDFPDLPDPQAMFDIHYFRKDPRPFFKFAKEIYPGQYKPSICHRFISLLEKNAKLLRNYSQNIDTLEQVAGITKVVQCHGSFATATCTNCGYKVDADVIREDVFNQVVPKCPRCQPEPGGRAILKPDIVFFGEGLPSFFYDCLDEDKRKVDLLIVIGSSLKVRPVATIPCPSVVGNSIPQILINREPLPHMNFDIELLGDGDVIINELCHRLGAGWDHICSSAARLREVTEVPRPSKGAGLPEQSGMGAERGGRCVNDAAEIPKPSDISKIGANDKGCVVPAPSPPVEQGSGEGGDSDLAHREIKHGPTQAVLNVGQEGLRTESPQQRDGSVKREKNAEIDAHEMDSENKRTESDMGRLKPESTDEERLVAKRELETAPTPPELSICSDTNGSVSAPTRTEGSESDKIDRNPCRDSVLEAPKAELLPSGVLGKVPMSGEAERRVVSQGENSGSHEGTSSRPHDKRLSSGTQEGDSGCPNGKNNSGSAGQRSSGNSASLSAGVRLEDAPKDATSSEKGRSRERRPRRQSITEYMEASTYLFIPPNRYVFHGAEVYSEDSSDGEESDVHSANHSADGMQSPPGSNPQENRAPYRYSQETSGSECSLLSPDSSTEAHVGSLQPTNEASSSQELSTADL